MTQEEALNILKMGHNVYLTGEAGAGKTYVLNLYIRWLMERHWGAGIYYSHGFRADGAEEVAFWQVSRYSCSRDRRDLYAVGSFSGYVRRCFAASQASPRQTVRRYAGGVFGRFLSTSSRGEGG